MPDLVPLEKLVSRLRTDLKLTKSSWAVKTLGSEVSHATQRKNQRKASILFYLEELQELKAKQQRKVSRQIADLKGKKVFIAGPMRGYEKYNFPKFDMIEKILKDNGVECVNPGRISRKFKEKDVNSDINVYNEMVRLQQEAEKTCNAILLLDGWQWSKGAQLEVKTAAELGMQFLLESDLPCEWFAIKPIDEGDGNGYLGDMLGDPEFNAKFIAKVDEAGQTVAEAKALLAELKKEEKRLDRGWLWHVNKFLWPFGVGGGIASFIVLLSTGHVYESCMQGLVLALMFAVWPSFMKED